MALPVLLATAPFDDGSVSRARPDESALVDRIRSGDVRALEVVFRSRTPALVRFACRLGTSHALGEEIVIDVFAAVWEMRERLDPALSLDAYLFRSVRNAALNARRGDRREVERIERATHGGAPPGFGTPAPVPDADVERESAATMVWDAVKTLPERQQTVLYLRYTRELSLVEVAQTMDVSVPAVKNMLQRAHQTLRVRLGGVFEAL